MITLRLYIVLSDISFAISGPGFRFEFGFGAGFDPGVSY